MRSRHHRNALAAMLVMVTAAGAAHAQAPTGKFDGDYLAPLRAKSCPADTTRTEPETIDLASRTVPLQGVNPSRKAIGDLTFIAGFHLGSSDKRLGGLSGLDLLDDGNLLAISDQGDFVWIDLSKDGVTPTTARIASMHDAKGASLHGKSEADSEGLAYMDGLALVSFEGDHRILAFDLGKCGADARGVPINTGRYGGDLSAAFARQKLKVGGNTGVEGLAIAPGWFMFAGLESKSGDTSPLSARAIESAPEFDLTIGKGMPPVVGLDILRDGNELRVFSLHRSTRALDSNVISIVETRFTRELAQAGLPANRITEIQERAHARFRPTSTRVLAQMNVFVTIDNFEGIAARQMPDGRVRLYVISDDNFSKKQRTLLMIYDLPARS